MFSVFCFLILAFSDKILYLFLKQALLASVIVLLCFCAFVHFLCRCIFYFLFLFSIFLTILDEETWKHVRLKLRPRGMSVDTSGELPKT